MKLIKHTTTKAWVTSGGHKTSAKFGIFECPSCKSSVEKSLSSGKKARSCGAKECRKATFQANPHNKGNTKKNKVTDKPYYSALAERYRQLKNEYTLCTEWGTLSGFINDMYDPYTKARDEGSKVYFRIHGNIASKESCRVVAVSKYNKFPVDKSTANKYLYLAKINNFIKIGITNNVKDRLCTIQTCSPYKVDLLHAKSIEDAYNIEQSLHIKYSDVKHSGEWFKLSNEQVKEITEYLDSLQ